MKDETQKLLIAAIFSLAAAYFLTHLHGTVAVPITDNHGMAFVYNTVTGNVTAACQHGDCRTSKDLYK